MEHLTDAPVANILILAGIIFVAVGLFGHIGGLVGSIFGSIEAGKNARILSGVLGAALIIGGGWMHQLPSPVPSPSPTPGPVPAPNPAPSPAGSFAGVWTDHDQENHPQGVFRLEIQQTGAQLSIHAWGGCATPASCDWGVAQVTASSDSAEVSLPSDPLKRKLQLTLSQSGELLGSVVRPNGKKGIDLTFLKSQ